MKTNAQNLQVLYEDNHLIVVNKRAGDIVQGDKTGDIPLSEIVKAYLVEKYHKPGEAYLWSCPLCQDLQSTPPPQCCFRH